jgi:hypothetical protein
LVATVRRSNLDGWFERVSVALAAVSALDLGYPLGQNTLREPATRYRVQGSQLDALYLTCDGLSAPDVHVGYFLDSSERTNSAADRGEPIAVEGEESFGVTIFGTDGGGGRFALRDDGGGIFYLPSGGAVVGGVFQETRRIRARIVADDMVGFLWRVLDDVEAFVEDRPGHAYLTAP